MWARDKRKIDRGQESHIKAVFLLLPCSLVFHEAWTLLEKLSGFPKDRPTHSARRQTLLAEPKLVPSQESRAKTEHQQHTHNCNEDCHWCSWTNSHRVKNEVWDASLCVQACTYTHIYRPLVLPFAFKKDKAIQTKPQTLQGSIPCCGQALGRER